VSILQIIVPSIIQGLCELLPVSSSAHVLVGARLIGIDPSSPEMTFLLVMLHTGTMFAVIVYFWNSYRWDYFASRAAMRTTIKELIAATLATAAVGGALLMLIEKVLLHRPTKSRSRNAFQQLHSDRDVFLMADEQKTLRSRVREAQRRRLFRE
jgi:undecaprenyl-diphosphatase